jgi:hypothetical protein
VLGMAGACDKTGDGEYQVERPVIGTETDTVYTPTVEAGTVKDTIRVPDVDIRMRDEEVTVPRVKVNEPRE